MEIRKEVLLRQIGPKLIVCNLVSMGATRTLGTSGAVKHSNGRESILSHFSALTGCKVYVIQLFF